MGRNKTGKWSPEEVALVRSIPKDTNTKQKLKKFSAKMNRPYPNVYAKWNTELKKQPETESGVPAMKFETVEYDGRSRVGVEEQQSMQKGLDLIVPDLTPTNKRAVLFPSRLVAKAKDYLRTTYKEHVYSFGTSKKKGFSLLYRRV